MYIYEKEKVMIESPQETKTRKKKDMSRIERAKRQGHNFSKDARLGKWSRICSMQIYR